MMPLAFEPLIKQIRWGGRRLGDVLGKPIGSASDYAESWELVDHGEDQSVVVAPDGADALGWTLSRLVTERGEDVFGPESNHVQFPLLIKYLDANDRLSVQVHPDDALAKAFDPCENGKTEAWVILDAQPGAKLYAGLQPGVTESQLRSALNDNSVESLLHTIPVKAGDCLFIPAGTIHAIGEGVLLAEVQQASDMTFRLYDWGRLGADGKPRQLHIEESIQATDWTRGPVDPVEPVEVSKGHERLVECDFFTIDRRSGIGGETRLDASSKARVLIGLSGSGQLMADDSVSLSFGLGKTVLVPAGENVTASEGIAFLDVGVP